MDFFNHKKNLFYFFFSLVGNVITSVFRHVTELYVTCTIIDFIRGQGGSLEYEEKENVL